MRCCHDRQCAAEPDNPCAGTYCASCEQLSCDVVLGVCTHQFTDPSAAQDAATTRADASAPPPSVCATSQLVRLLG
ncbi:hypothetical protein XAR_4563 [Xanthomonas citri pv. glycines str. 8ra]|nr:hypothetical protein XAR_4563 [Xanthomonas citri pv. glycines str. 8ra]